MLQPAAASMDPDERQTQDHMSCMTSGTATVGQMFFFFSFAWLRDTGQQEKMKSPPK